MAEVLVTKSAALALADERGLMRQGYQFLDEKRMLLAAEMLRGLAQHEALTAALIERLRSAGTGLRGALQRHGLEGLQAYPPTALAPPRAKPIRTLFLGVTVQGVAFDERGAEPQDPAVDASPEARTCRDAFVALFEPLAQLAACAGNLERLAAEYRRTERRAQALDNVLLPEIEASLKAIEEQLELADQEEAVRIRQAARRR